MTRGWDFSLRELEAQSPGGGLPQPPDIDTRGFLLAELRRAPQF
jgi:hypothetical protein